MNLWTVFLTGLFTGGLTCLAVQGGLLATSIAQREGEQLTGKVKRSGHGLPIIFFLLAKLFSYTLLGFLLGALGSVFTFSLQAQIILQLFIALFMIGTALALLNVHPIFRYFIIQPPKFLYRLVRNESRSKGFFAPILLGVFTVFVPCGTTQAMMALSIASGSPILGATILAVFVIGTSPLFFALGYFASRIGGIFQSRFTQVTAALVILLAFFNLNNVVALSGSTYTVENLLVRIQCTISFCPRDVDENKFVVTSTPTILISSSGYSPNNIALKAGSHVKLTLTNTDGVGCTQAFTIPKLGIQKIVRNGASDIVEFDVPNEKGSLPFMCSMGMYRGAFQII